MRYDQFFIKHLFPRPELLAFIIKEVDARRLNRQQARKLINDHIEYRKRLFAEQP